VRRRRWILLALVLVAAAVFVGRQLWGTGGAVDPSEWYTRTVYPLEHEATIRAAAKKNGVDPALVSAVIYVESGFDAEARSSQGAVGLMQVLPETARQIARETGGTAFETADLENPRVNVRYGTYYLRQALDQFDGSTLAAVAAYNAGGGAVSKWVAAAESEGRSLRTTDIPYAETRAYVKEVLRVRKVYRETYGEQFTARPSPSPSGS